ncbi:MAG: type II toxin-antitoxin system Phd/YefM family antitoxin [Desulfobacteraceae bacterium]|nr:MAG: type II toxin-antitoxin system Phd/YefM family antitoxin [Desulfobacteraceae bacterium]
MMLNISIAEAKSKFSEIIARTIYAGERFIVRRRGKPVAAIVGIDDLRKIQLTNSSEDTGTLLAAAEAWADFKDLDRVIEDIYRSRRKSTDRKVTIE